MKRIFCVLMILVCAAGFARAEAPALPAIVAAASAAKANGTEFSCESLVVSLPDGMEALADADLEGYNAAVESDYPGAATLVMIAEHIEREAHVAFSTIDSAQPAAEAAREAALKILGSDSDVTDIVINENAYSCFTYTLELISFQLYFHSNGSQLLCIAESGLEDEEISLILETLEF